MLTKAITLLSGGLDSVVATVLAKKDHDIVLALTFDYGQRAAEQEISISKILCSSLGIEHRSIKLPWLGEMTTTSLVNRSEIIPKVFPELLDDGGPERAKAVWVPNRNGVFIAIAAAIAESRNCKAIIAGFNAEEANNYPDNSSAFVTAANAALKLSTKNGVVVTSPTIGMGKDDIAHRFVAQNLDPDTFWCCYDGGEKMCGHCESCARTIRAFKKVGAWELIKRRFMELI